MSSRAPSPWNDGPTWCRCSGGVGRTPHGAGAASLSTCPASGRPPHLPTSRRRSTVKLNSLGPRPGFWPIVTTKRSAGRASGRGDSSPVLSATLDCRGHWGTMAARCGGSRALSWRAGIDGQAWAGPSCKGQSSLRAAMGQAPWKATRLTWRVFRRREYPDPRSTRALWPCFWRPASARPPGPLPQGPSCERCSDRKERPGRTGQTGCLGRALTSVDGLGR